MIDENISSILVCAKAAVSRSQFSRHTLRREDRVSGFFPACSVQKIGVLIRCQQSDHIQVAGSCAGKCHIDLSVILDHKGSFVYSRIYSVPAVLIAQDAHRIAGQLIRIGRINSRDPQVGSTVSSGNLSLCPAQIMCISHLEIRHIKSNPLVVQSRSVFSCHRLRVFPVRSDGRIPAFFQLHELALYLIPGASLRVQNI